MTERVILRVLLAPAPRSGAWRKALAAACSDAGWDYKEWWGGALPALKPDHNALIIGWSYDQSIPEAHWCVLACDPQSGAACLKQHRDLPEGELLYHVAGRFGIMSKLAKEGAPVWRDDSEVIEVPFLGKVRAAGEPYTPPTAQGPLAIYETIPPLAGSTAEWPGRHFNYPDSTTTNAGGVKLELTGRRRLLLNGPNFSLPPGLWTARARFDLDPQWTAVDLLMEWGHGVSVQSLRQVLTASGRYELTMTHRWEIAAPGDFRISIMMPVLDGTLTFHGVTVECEHDH